ncbi:gliding motility-associated C-terminal domain-containing protein [Tamlana agarivorans]|uniref:Gliding motility-associated C-terminal domain-containing protein n=1 Tax=Pseudotamlana agarivorans TaxID=481183 RepID=A0ACC5UA20_9FLAO|nr:gliding motility-associated C-terminal domain-containing protein [Tamlana agarivorans]MBU2951172.1 gliding motility-associated C-terminal domain-containing protein [Tamlana agarivorans]
MGTTPTGTTNIDACPIEADIDAIVTTASDITAIEAAYSDNCGTVTASFESQTLSGDQCAWSLERIYTISDGCMANDFDITITHTGSDQQAATGIAPTGTANIDACPVEVDIDAIVTTASDIAAIESAYIDNCGTVTASFESQTLSGDQCAWSLERTYTISDGCSTNNFDITITHSGSDQQAATGIVPTGTANIDACPIEADIDVLVTTSSDITAIEAAYTDNCGIVTASFVSQTLSGDQCAWSLERTYTVSDGCIANDFDITITHTGSDQQAATGIAPTGTTNIDACPIEVDIDAIVTTASDIAAIETAYSDNCGTVTASFVSQTLSGDQCAWSLERIYIVSDGCMANDFDITITHSGSDQQAATGIAPTGTTNIDACPIEVDIDAIVTTASDIAAIEAAYTDNCGIVTASFVSQTLSGDQCAWSLERTYTVSDGCSANNFNITMTHSGSDQQAATGIAPTGTTNIDACPIEVDIDAIVTTASDIAAIEAAYTDNCGTVTASFVSQTLSGDQCAWSLERTYTVSDGCMANDFNITITHTGSDQTPAMGTTPTGTANIDACPIEADIDAIVTTASDIAAIEAAYSDNCGTVTASFESQTLSGDQCAWSLERTYTVSDGCMANDFDITITHTGSDQQAATGIAPTGTNNIDACPIEADIDTIVTTASDIASIEAVYTDNCGIVTASFLSQTLSGDQCAWSLERIYTISDGCSTNNFDITITHSGSDQQAATGIAPTGTTNIDACPVEVDIDARVTTASDIASIEAAYTDNCGIVTASFVSQTLSGDQCAWSLERTYTVSDGCSVNNFDITITHSGSDQTPATGISPTGTANIDACPIEADIDVLVTTASDITAIEAAYTDNCGTVTASFVSQTPSGDQCAWSLERTYTVSDGCIANDFDITITHTGSDQQAATGIAPTGTTNIDACPIELDIDAIVTTASDIAAIEAAYTDNCGIVTASFVSQTLSGDQCAWSLERTYTVSDGCMASDFDITITHSGSDQTPAMGSTPIGTANIDACPIEVDIDAIVTTASDITAIEATYTDNCGIVTASFVSQTLSGDQCAWSLERTYTVSDGCSANNFDITITHSGSDQTAPVIDIQNKNDIEIICGKGDTQQQILDWLNSNAGATANDNCGNITWSNDYGGDNTVKCKLGKGIVVNFTAEDACGNTSSTSAIYHIKDLIAPSIITPAADLTVECDGSGNLAELNNWLTINGGAVATEDCSTMTWSNDFTMLSDECGETGMAIVIFTVQDACGNETSSTATFKIEDTKAPLTPSTPLDITYECIADVPPVGSLTAIDDCSGNITALGVDNINNTDPLNIIITRTWTFVDDCSNTSSTTQIITVKDTTPPVLNLPVNVTAQCSDNLTPIAFGIATAIDNCDPNPIVTYNDVRKDGACSGTFTITRTWTTTDISGNSVSVDQQISTSDTTAPDFDQTILPADAVVECDNIPSNETLTATDNCGNATVSVTDVIIDGHCPFNYIIERRYLATDDCGNSRIHLQTITVQDTTAPQFVETLPPLTLTVECDAIPTPEILTATDNCGTASVTVREIKTIDNCENNYSLARIWTATDECGLTTTHTQIITVQDTQAPQFVEALPSNITVECDAVPDVTILTATDNCGTATVTYNDVKTIGNCINNYIIERTFTAKDECGLISTHTQTITVQDTTAPVPSTSFSTTLDVSCTNIPEVPNVTFTDNCTANITIDYNETNSFDENVFQDYQIVRTWKVADECLNEAIYTQTINVRLDEIFTEFVAPDICFNDGIVDLFSLIPEDLNTRGTWEIIEGESGATLEANIFNPTVIKMSEDFRPGTEGIIYRFRYTTTNNGCISVNEVVMNLHADCVVLPCGEDEINISTAITPNGDGYNDTFDIKGIDLCGFVAEVKIFNRWGALVYQSNDYTLGSIETSGVEGDWDGSSPNASLGSNGRLPSGTYYYIINLKNSGISPLTGPIYIGTK